MAFEYPWISPHIYMNIIGRNSTPSLIVVSNSRPLSSSRAVDASQHDATLLVIVPRCRHIISTLRPSCHPAPSTRRQHVLTLVVVPRQWQVVNTPHPSSSFINGTRHRLHGSHRPSSTALVVDSSALIDSSEFVTSPSPLVDSNDNSGAPSIITSG